MSVIYLIVFHLILHLALYTQILHVGLQYMCYNQMFKTVDLWKTLRVYTQAPQNTTATTKT